MFRNLALIVAASASAIVADKEKSTIDLLDRTVWVDVGIVTNADTLSARRIAGLRSCPAVTMSFEKAIDGIVQVFYAGIATRTHYAPVRVSVDGKGRTISLYTAGNPMPAEVLHLSRDGTELVQDVAGFHPHTFLKCTAWDAKPSGQKNPRARH